MQELLMITVMFAISFLLWIGQKSPCKTSTKSQSSIERCSYAAIRNGLIFVIFIFYFVLRNIENGAGGIDAIIYKQRFLAAVGDPISAIKLQDYEIGYSIFVYIVRLFTDDFRIFQLIYYFILLLLINNINKDITRSAISFPMTMIFITINLMLSLCLLRNQLSCFLAYNSILYFTKGNKKKSCFFLLMAISCHISAVIVIFGYFLFYLRKKFDLSLFIFLVIIIVFVMFGCSKILENVLHGTRYAIYFSGRPDIGYGQLLRFVLVILFFKYCYYKRKVPDIYNMHLMQIISMVAVLPMQLVMPIVYRMFPMTAYSQMELCNEAYLFKTASKNNRKFFIILAAIIIMSIELYLFFTQSVPSYGLLQF